MTFRGVFMEDHIEGKEDLRILQGIQSLELQNDPIHIDVKQRKRATYDEIEERQNEILRILVDNPGISQEALSTMLGVSISTLQRDLVVVKNRSFKWIEELSRGDFIHRARIASLRIDRHIAILQERINSGNLDPKNEALLMKTINEFAQLQLDLEAKPLFYQLKKINDKLGQIPQQLRTWQNHDV